jgi:hypothetical protein
MWKHLIGLLAIAGCGADNGGPIQFTASGEVLALGGYAFPPADPANDPAFVDGWEIRFTKFFAVFDKVTLSENPDAVPTDQSQTGKLVAEIDGPWAIDLHKGGPLVGKGGSDEQAYPIQTIMNQNRNGNAAFDATKRYAFGFDSVPATASAQLIQIDASDPDWQAMVQNGWNVLYVGTATWNGNKNGNTCTQTGGANGDAALASLPTVGSNGTTSISFRLGFKTPTTYVNCQNPDTGDAPGLNGEEHLRGVQPKANATTIAQVTFHTDHPFWESFAHDTPAHFDQLAALAKKQGDGSYLVTLDDTKGVDYKAFTAPNGMPLPWHDCIGSNYTPPDNGPQMKFDSLNIQENPSGDPKSVMRDYQDYMNYNQSTQGHLNSDGLCFVQRHYDSPQ